MDTNASYLLRWRGRQQGPLPFSQIERKLSENEIGMLHEIFVNGEWVTLKACFEQIDAERRAEAERLAAAERAAASFSQPIITQPSVPSEMPAHNQFHGSSETPISWQDYVLDIGTCFNRAWEALTKNFAVTLVSTVLYSVFALAIPVYFWVGKLIALVFSAAVHPIFYFLVLGILFVISIILGGLVRGVLYGGLYYVFIGLVRRDSRSIGDLFAGFRGKIGRLMLGYIAPHFLILIALAIGLLPLFGMVLFTGMGTGALKNPEAVIEGLGRLWIILTIFYLVAFYIPMWLWLCARFFYVVPLIVDKDLSVNEAIKASWLKVGHHTWRFILLNQIAVLIWFSGFLLCGIGMLLTWPFYLMIMAAAYTIIFEESEEVDLTGDKSSNSHGTGTQAGAYSRTGTAGDQTIPPDKSATNTKAIWIVVIVLAVFALSVVGVLAAVYLPSLGNNKAKNQRIQCENNLKQIGLAFKIWSGDNNDKFPWQLSVTNSGTMELSDLGPDGFDRNGAVHFQVASNELSTPKILVCPADSSKPATKDFASLKSVNISYLLRTGTEVDETNPTAVMARCPIHGIELYCDGSVKTSKPK